MNYVKHKSVQSNINLGIAELESEGTKTSMLSILTSMAPKQLVLPGYLGTKFSSEPFMRQHPPEWFKKYPCVA